MCALDKIHSLALALHPLGEQFVHEPSLTLKAQLISSVGECNRWHSAVFAGWDGHVRVLRKEKTGEWSCKGLSMTGENQPRDERHTTVL